MILGVVQAILNLYSSTLNASEDTLVRKVLSLFFFDDDFIECVWANSTLSASASRKRKFDPSLQGRKPDFMVSTASGQCKAHLLIAEVKPEGHHVADSGPWNDLVKLGNELKDTIDEIIEHGVEATEVCGLLVQGFRCDLFVMDLKFDGLYRMIRVGRFYLPRDRHNFSVLPDAIEVLLQGKRIVTRSAEHCIKGFHDMLTREETPSPKAVMTSLYQSYLQEIELAMRIMDCEESDNIIEDATSINI